MNSNWKEKILTPPTSSGSGIQPNSCITTITQSVLKTDSGLGKLELLSKAIPGETLTDPTVDDLIVRIAGVDQVFFLLDRASHVPSEIELYLLLHCDCLIVLSTDHAKIRSAIQCGLDLAPAVRAVRPYLLERIHHSIENPIEPDSVQDVLTSLFECFLGKAHLEELLKIWHLAEWDPDELHRFVARINGSQTILKKLLERTNFKHRFRFSDPLYCQKHHGDLKLILWIRNHLLDPEDPVVQLTNTIILNKIDASILVFPKYLQVASCLPFDFQHPWFFMHVWMLRGDHYCQQNLINCILPTIDSPYGRHLHWVLELLVDHPKKSEAILEGLISAYPNYFEHDEHNGPIDKWFLLELALLRIGMPDAAKYCHAKAISINPDWKRMIHPRKQAIDGALERPFAPSLVQRIIQGFESS